MGERTVLLSLQSVSKVYRMGEVDVHALRDITLDIHDGELLVVLGPSGSGKSTLLNLAGGMDRASSGSVFFEGADLMRATESRITAYRRKEVGFVFQFFNLIPTLTALENVQVGTEIAPGDHDPRYWLSMVGLGDRADHFPAQLSGGEQQRVAIARALAADPRFVLCDEPTGSLDLATGIQILRLLVDLKERLRKAIVIITHNSGIAALGERTAYIKDGRVDAVTVNESPRAPEEIQW